MVWCAWIEPIVFKPVSESVHPLLEVHMRKNIFYCVLSLFLLAGLGTIGGCSNERSWGNKTTTTVTTESSGYEEYPDDDDCRAHQHRRAYNNGCLTTRVVPVETPCVRHHARPMPERVVEGDDDYCHCPPGPSYCGRPRRPGYVAPQQAPAGCPPSMGGTYMQTEVDVHVRTYMDSRGNVRRY